MSTGEHEQRRIRMNTTMAGHGFAYSHDEEVVVDEPLAVALCSEPEDSPRATPIGWELDDKGRARTATAPPDKEKTVKAPGEPVRRRTQKPETPPPADDNNPE